MSEEPKDNPQALVTREYLSLQLAAFRSDMTLRIVAGIVASNFLSSVTLPTTLSFTAIVGTIIVVAGKALLWH